MFVYENYLDLSYRKKGMMFFFKLLYHLQAWLKLMLYRLLWPRNMHFGRGVTFRKGFTLLLDRGGQVYIGDGVFFNNGCSVIAMESVSIGAHTLFGENVKIYDHNHCFAARKRLIKEQGYSTSSVHIGEDCWIGSNTVILRHADIGDHCVIGAGCVINGPVPAGTIVTAGKLQHMQPICFKD